MAAAAFNQRAVLLRVVVLAAALLAAALVSLCPGQDANWDLRNYHFYNPYAFLSDRLDWDVAPAQLQSFFNPLADLPFYWAVHSDLSPRWIAILLALPAGIAGFFLFLSVERLFGVSSLPQRLLYVVLALLIGVTGTAGVSLIGATTNDWPTATLVVIAIWLLLRSIDIQGERKWIAIAFAGFLSGAAGGLKLTAALYSPSLCIALLVTVRPFRYRAVACATTFAALAALGFIATAGFWLWQMQARFGNPFFPYFNDWFRSPWWDAWPIQDPYGPRSISDWLAFPFRLLRYNAGVVSEMAFRDWRIPMLFIAAIAAVIRFAIRKALGWPLESPRVIRQWRFIIVFWFVSFVLWAFEHSIYRYIIPLELFAGAITIFLLLTTLPARARPVAAVALTCLILIRTAYPASLRIPFADHFFVIEAPTVPNHSLVLLVEDEPLAYVIPFLNPSSRFVGAKNNFTDPERHHLVARRIRDIIATHNGKLFALQSPKRRGDDALTAYGLEKITGGCATIETNMTGGPLSLCELRRTSMR